MGSAPVSLPLRHWKATRTICLAAAVVLICAVAPAQDPAARSLLLFPVRSHWLSAPLADALTGALARELGQSGIRVVSANPQAPVVRLAASEGWIHRDDLAADRLQSKRHTLAVATGTAASLTAVLIEGETEASLNIILAGAVSRREASQQITAPLGRTPQEVARDLARQVVHALETGLWAAADADHEGRRRAAAERYAAGREALAQAMYRDALLHFEAALLGEPDNTDYLRRAAEARVGLKDYSGALVRLRTLASRQPDDVEVALQLGDVALMAGEPERAEAAFLSAEALSPGDERVLEGLARSARARGALERSELYYGRLLGQLGMASVHWSGGTQGGRIVSGRAWGGYQSLAAVLAAQPDDSIRIAAVPADIRALQFAQAYLRSGWTAHGLDALEAYHAEADVPTYTEAAYLDIFPVLDEESEAVARDTQRALASRAVGELDDEEADSEIDSLHDRSDRLATLAEQMQVAPRVDPAHRYRVLAYNMLNESNFEALMFARTQDPDHHRRAELLRAAFREARAQANLLCQALLGSAEIVEPRPLPPPAEPAGE